MIGCPAIYSQRSLTVAYVTSNSDEDGWREGGLVSTSWARKQRLRKFQSWLV